MSRLQMGDPGLAPDSLLAYIEDMLFELAQLAEISGEAALAGAIRRAAETTPATPSSTPLVISRLEPPLAKADDAA